MLFGFYFLYLTFLLLLLCGFFLTTLEGKEGKLCLENILISVLSSHLFILLAFSFARYIGIVPKYIFFKTYFLTRTFVFYVLQVEMLT